MCYNCTVDKNAAMAQLVERILGKDEVISSTLISSSKSTPFGVLFALCIQAI